MTSRARSVAMTRHLKTMKPKSWHLISVRITREAEELASNLLFDLGTTGVVTLEEDAETVKLGAYFSQTLNATKLTQHIETEWQRAGRGEVLLGIEVADVLDQDWMQKWKEGFHPITVGKRILIAPSWQLPETSDGRIVIRIDPGMAFGTGTHETTRLCLEAIERHWRGGTLLDVGTGTSILAIAAAKLAPEAQITAIDIDPLAVEVGRENISVNGVPANIAIREGQPRDCAGQTFDLVVANLTAEVIIELFDDLLACLAQEGVLILSGILTTLVADVEQRAGAEPMAIIERREAGEWSLLVAQRGNA